MKATERLQELGVKVYTQTAQEDRCLAVLWDRLDGNGDLSLITAQSARSLSGFLAMFAPPSVLLYTMLDEQASEIESINWATPMGISDNCVYFSAWMHESVRGTRRHAVLASTIYEAIFEMGKQTIIGITKQQQILPLHTKMGYIIVDQVPHLFDDHPAWFMYLTKPSFEKSKLLATANRIANKELN